MSRRRKGRDIHGVLLLDKPAGYSSNQAVQKVRWLFQARKAGHTGSLDPFATGMLPICLGEASKTAGFMLDASKTYIATALLGQATSTGDIEGETTREMPNPELTAVEIEAVLSEFLGQTKQIPPMYSALKHKGQPLYKLAREGKEVSREARTITLHSLELLSWESPLLEFKVHCSKGTYIRTLAEDIAQQLGSCAHLKALRRLDVEPFKEEDMIGLEQLVAMAEAGTLDDCLLKPDAGLEDWPLIVLKDDGEKRFSHGNPLEHVSGEPGMVRVYGADGIMLGLGEIDSGQNLRPKRLFRY